MKTALLMALTLCFTAAVAAPTPTTSTAPAASADAPADSASPIAHAMTPEELALKKVIEDRLKLVVDEVTPIPVPGLYEIRVGKRMVYSDAKGNYLFTGDLIDLKARTNLSQARADSIEEALEPKVKLADLPLKSAIKIVKGNGKRQLAIFEDPNCGFCKRLEKSLTAINDVTLYVFLYPVLGPDSVAKSKSIWCSKDPAKTWDDWMSTGAPISASASCDTSVIDKNLALGDKLQVSGTPTLFFANGKRIPGAIGEDDIVKLLNAG